MPFYLTFLMIYYQNYSHAMYLYLCMHGTYGWLWYLKHITYPDKTFEEYITFGSTLCCWVLLGAYCLPGWLLASGKCYDADKGEEPTKLRMYVSLLMYIIGVTITLVSDFQKTLTLKYVKERPFLICDGMFKYTRNPNYFGEILLYLSFATITNHWITYCVVAFPCLTIFPARIFQKEISLRKKPGFKEYE